MGAWAWAIDGLSAENARLKARLAEYAPLVAAARQLVDGMQSEHGLRSARDSTSVAMRADVVDALNDTIAALEQVEDATNQNRERA